ncbi:MAG: HD domain-containing protein [Desulfurococcales archaeon]|nr:HD domain-containing protein [Desulfurococcales archaeon]
MRLRLMELLAFKDECSMETLRKHIRTMYELYAELFRDRGWARIASKRVGLDEEELDLAVRLTIAFHDAGKAFYQDRIARGKGAPLHEAYSILILRDYIDFNKLSRQLDDHAIMSIIWSILTHHLSMRSPRDVLQVLGGTSDFGHIPREARLDTTLKVMLEDAISDVVNPSTLPSKLYRMSDAQTLIVEALGSLHDYYKLSLRLSRILIVTDNMAAYLNRASQCRDRENPNRRRIKVFISDMPGPEYDHARGELISWLDVF